MQAILHLIAGTTVNDMQSPAQVRDFLIVLNAHLATANEQMAVAGRAYNIAKRDAYLKLQQEQEAAGKNKLSPLLAKDYVASLCSKEAFAYDLAERTSRTISHTMDSCRSVLSSQKSEMQYLNYNQA